MVGHHQWLGLLYLPALDLPDWQSVHLTRRNCLPWTDDHGITREITDVFISYSHVDRDQVVAIAERLVAESLTVFWDPDIPPGQSYTAFLRKALENSRIVLVVWSRHSIDSEWVAAEAEFARSRKRLVSCRIENCALNPPFNTFQTVDLSDWKGSTTDKDWSQVVDLIRLRVTTGNATTPIGEVNA